MTVHVFTSATFVFILRDLCVAAVRNFAKQSQLRGRRLWDFGLRSAD